MPNWLRIDGGTVLSLAVIGCLLVVAGFFVVRGPVREAQAYADEVIPIVFSSWNSEVLLSRASTEFLEQNRPEEVKVHFSALSERLGILWEHRTVSGHVNVILGAPTEAALQSDATFEKGPATIVMSLVKRDGVWQIMSLNVTSGAPRAP